jgi:hypothetical protein
MVNEVIVTMNDERLYVRTQTAMSPVDVLYSFVSFVVSSVSLVFFQEGRKCETTVLARTFVDYSTY